jgi:hypothetical protein
MDSCGVNSAQDYFVVQLAGLDFKARAIESRKDFDESRD